MIYYLYFSVVLSFVIAIWYDLALEDEILQNKKLSDSDKLNIDGLIMKRAKPRFFFRKGMFASKNWNINKRVRFFLILHFLNITNVYLSAFLYFILTRD